MNLKSADQSVFDKFTTKAPAPLMLALDNLRGNKFAKEQNALNSQTAPFRALSWTDLAVRLSVEPPEQSAQEHEAADDEDSSSKNTSPEQARQDAPPAQLNEGDGHAKLLGFSPVEEAYHTPIPDQHSVEPQDVVIDQAGLQKMLDEAYAEGLSAGKAMTESEREAALSAQFDQLGQIMARLEAPDLLDISALTSSINNAVLALASQRVGYVLDEMPETLIRKIDGLLENLAHLSGQRELFLSPEDLRLVGAFFSNRQAAPLLQVHADSTLLRGDVRLRIGGVEMTDVLASVHEGAYTSAGGRNEDG
jgi:flagellar assembly protein FliH